jgi:putative Ca2+/H+ antiporter (TMEM165/GDT1 family)
MPGLATGVSRKPSPSFSTLIGMGVAMALCVGVGVGGGYWLDRTFHTGELLTFVGLALGVIAAVAVVYFDVKTYL